MHMTHTMDMPATETQLSLDAIDLFVPVVTKHGEQPSMLADFAAPAASGDEDQDDAPAAPLCPCGKPAEHLDADEDSPEWACLVPALCPHGRLVNQDCSGCAYEAGYSAGAHVPPLAESWILVVEWINSGRTYFGPFASSDDAESFARPAVDANPACESWDVALMSNPL